MDIFCFIVYRYVYIYICVCVFIVYIIYYSKLPYESCIGHKRMQKCKHQLCYLCSIYSLNLSRIKLTDRIVIICIGIDCKLASAVSCFAKYYCPPPDLKPHLFTGRGHVSKARDWFLELLI